MRYDWMTVLMVPEASRLAAEQIGRQLTGEAAQNETDDTDDAASPPTYAIALSATGDTPVQFRACCTAVSDAMLQQMQAVLRTNGLPGVRYWRWSSQWGTLSATNAPVSESHLGEAWDWFRCLEDAGLSVVAPLPPIMGGL